MISDLSDKEQIEVFKKWWRDYGRSITCAVVVGLLIGLGWRYWHQHQAHYAQQASTIYYQLQVANQQNQTAQVQSLTSQLMQQYARTPYASLAALFAAKQAVSQNHYADALQQLQWVMQHSRLSSIKQIARLRAARVLLAQQQSQAALQLLQHVDDVAYQPLIDHVKGDIYAAMGNGAAAQQAYQTAQNEAHAAGIVDPVLQMKVSQ